MPGICSTFQRGSGGEKTLLAQPVRIQGDVHFSGHLHVDGTVKGDILAGAGTTSVLSISEHASIECTVRAGTVILNGVVNSEIHADERIELAARAKVDGDVYYRLIDMALGARVLGRLIHQKTAAAAVIAFGHDVGAGPDAQV